MKDYWKSLDHAQSIYEKLTKYFTSIALYCLLKKWIHLKYKICIKKSPL